MKNSTKRKNRESGSAMVEIALLSPWIFFLFVGVFDFGFYAYAIICTENAARAAAVQTAASAGVQSTANACDGAWDELKGLPNVAALTKNCAQLPVIVTQQTLCGSAVDTAVITTCISAPPTNPLCADCTLNNKAASSKVSVQYRSMPLVPIPGILTNQTTITRIVEMRIIAE